MAHYVIIDENNFVINGHVGRDENDIVLDNNGNPITNYKNSSIEDLRSADITSFLMSYGNNDVLELLKALDYNTETDE